MAKPNYTAPKIEQVAVAPVVEETAVEVAAEADVIEAEKAEVVVAAAAPVIEEEVPAAPAVNTGAKIKFKDLEIVRVAEMINAKNDFVSQTMIDRIEQHLVYLNGKQGFANDEARFKEQITIMETIGNSIILPIDKYCLVTDYLLQAIRCNYDSFKEGQAFRFMRGLNKVYSDRSIANYQSYMTMLITLAGSYADRKRTFTKIDLDSITATLPTDARNNINTYIRRICE